MPTPLFKKGNKAATVNKGKRKKFTELKRKIVEWDEAGKLVERNILEFLNSPNKKDRMYATKNFAEFVKPKKKEISGELTNEINYNHKVFVVPAFKIEENAREIEEKNNELKEENEN